MTAVLAIDTATNACSAALLVDGDVRASRFEPMSGGHAERLIPMIQEIAEVANRAVKSVDLIAVTIGPGAFTGLRVGLAAARAFALSAGVPCLGLTTLEVIAAGVGPLGNPLVIGLDSKRTDVYVQVFNPDGQAVSEPTAILPEAVSLFVGACVADATRVSVAGDAASVVKECLNGDSVVVTTVNAPYPDAAVLARLAVARWVPGEPIDRPVPLYLRTPDAVIPRNGGRLRP